jgi:hypothetical protein
LIFSIFNFGTPVVFIYEIYISQFCGGIINLVKIAYII